MDENLRMCYYRAFHTLYAYTGVQYDIGFNMTYKKVKKTYTFDPYASDTIFDIYFTADIPKYIESIKTNNLQRYRFQMTEIEEVFVTQPSVYWIPEGLTEEYINEELFGEDSAYDQFVNFLQVLFYEVFIKSKILPKNNSDTQLSADKPAKGRLGQTHKSPQQRVQRSPLIKLFEEPKPIIQR
ncbi:hypothetical protein QTN25_004101 [Entamoeba marina]